MAHYAKVKNNIVVDVIVAEQDFVDSLPQQPDVIWVQTSYNTYQNTHRLGGTPLRKNYAAVGFTYDNVRDAFIPPQPFGQWILNEETCVWEPPYSPPNDGNNYMWNEYTNDWVKWDYLPNDSQ